MRYLIDLTEEEFKQTIAEATAIAIREHQPEEKTTRPKYGTRNEVKKVIHVSLPTLNRMNKEGILKAHKISGRVLYLWDEVFASIEQGQSLKYRRI
jgi:hypothetical protein